jgi:hypothetical protein
MTTDTPSEINNLLKKVPLDSDDGFYYHQRLTYAYMLETDIRGLLLMYDTGYGKTREASAIAELFLENGWEPIIMAGKTLHANFKKGLIEYRQTLDKYKKAPLSVIENDINDKYKFISSNASNVVTQVEKVVEGMDGTDDTLDAKLDKVLGSITTLEGKCIIWDEAHNFFNSITNPSSKNAKRLYEMIMNTKKIKLLFMTANPIINEPFEIVPAMNMLKGYLYDSEGKRSTLFPEDWSDFNKHFVDTEKLSIKNSDKFKNRIVGMISYFGGLYEENVKSQTGRKDVIARKDFPDELPTKVVEVPMGERQWSAYIIAEEQEKRESSRIFGQRDKVALVKPGLVGASTYRIKTRQISNYAMPSYIKAKPEDRANLITDEDLENIGEDGAKIPVLLDNLLKHNKNLVYSQFLNGTLRVAERKMETMGWTKWTPTFKTSSKVPKPPKKGRKSVNRVYVEISGDVSVDDREKILEYYNSEKNRYGALVNDLFITAAGAEGIDGKDIDGTHEFEQFWNPSRHRQVKARAIRLKAHEGRPAKDRIVQPYIYLAIPPPNAKHPEPTTDQDLYTRATNTEKLNQTFIKCLIEASIDCMIHTHKTNIKDIKCMVCKPTGENLYTPHFYDDMVSHNPCSPLEEESIKVQKIKMDDQVYYYRIPDNSHPEIYKYVENLDSYVPLEPTDEIYIKILEKIK